MKIDNLLQSIKSKEWLKKHVGYFDGDLYSLTDSGFETTEIKSKVMIVSRKHYVESWKTYPSITASELKEILKLQKQTDNKVIKHVYSKNVQQEGFDVKTIEFSQQIAEQFPENVLIPEVELISRYYQQQTVAVQISTPSGELLYATSEGKAHSAYKRGLVSSLRVFAFSIGLSEQSQQITLDQTQYSQLLWQVIKSYPLTQLDKLIYFDVKKSINLPILHAVYWAPLISALLFTGVVGGYYYLYDLSLDEQLSENRQQVNELLQKKQSIDKSRNYVVGASTELTKYRSVLSDFQIAQEAIKAGMDIQQFKGDENGVSLRGFADSASSVLQTMSDLPELASAEFNGPVRKSGTRDYFIMQLVLVDTDEK